MYLKRFSLKVNHQSIGIFELIITKLYYLTDITYQQT